MPCLLTIYASTGVKKHLKLGFQIDGSWLTRPPAYSAWFDRLKLCFETAGSWSFQAGHHSEILYQGLSFNLAPHPLQVYSPQDISPFECLRQSYHTVTATMSKMAVAMQEGEYDAEKTMSAVRLVC